MARVKAYQESHKDEIKKRKADYYQQNKNRYRITDGIRRTKASIAKFEAEGRERMAEKTRERLVRLEEEYQSILAG